MSVVRDKLNPAAMSCVLFNEVWKKTGGTLGYSQCNGQGIVYQKIVQESEDLLMFNDCKN